MSGNPKWCGACAINKVLTIATSVAFKGEEKLGEGSLMMRNHTRFQGRVYASMKKHGDDDEKRLV